MLGGLDCQDWFKLAQKCQGDPLGLVFKSWPIIEKKLGHTPRATFNKWPTLDRKSNLEVFLQQFALFFHGA